MLSISDGRTGLLGERRARQAFAVEGEPLAIALAVVVLLALVL